MTREERLQRAARALSVDERKAMLRALRSAYALKPGTAKQVMIFRLETLGFAMERTDRRRRSDRKTDGARRKLVGARLPLEDAERCRKCAQMEGVSLYRFVVRALRVACETAETAAAQRVQEFSDR